MLTSYRSGVSKVSIGCSREKLSMRTQPTGVWESHEREGSSSCNSKWRADRIEKSDKQVNVWFDNFLFRIENN